MAKDFASIINQMNQQSSMGDMIMKTVVNEFVKDIFDSGSDQEERNAIADEKWETTSMLSGETSYNNRLKRHNDNLNMDLTYLIGSIKSDPKYVKDGNTDFATMNQDLQTAFKGMKTDFSNNFSVKKLNDKGTEENQYGHYDFRGINGDVQQGFSPELQKMAHSVAKRTENMLQSTLQKTVASNTIAEQHQNVTNKLISLPTAELDYQGKEGSVLDLINKMNKSVNSANAMDNKSKAIDSAGSDYNSSYKKLASAINRAAEYDVADDVGLQLNDLVGSVPFIFDEKEKEKLNAEERMAYDDLSKGSLKIDNKSVQIKDVAKEIDVLIRAGGDRNINQAMFLMNKILPGEEIKAKTKLLKDTAQADLEKEIIGKINEDNNSYKQMHQAVGHAIGKVSDGEYVVGQDGFSIFKRNVRAKDNTEGAFGLMADQGLNSNMQGIYDSLQPLAKRAQNSTDLNTSDENLIGLESASKDMFKMLLRGQNGNYKGYLTGSNAEGKEVKYGIGQGDFIDINLVNESDLIKFINTQAQLGGSIGLLALQDSKNKEVYWGSNRYSQDGNFTSQWHDEAQGGASGENKALDGLEGTIASDLASLWVAKSKSFNENVADQNSILKISTLPIDDMTTKIDSNKLKEGDKKPKAGKNGGILDPDFKVKTDLDLKLESESSEQGRIVNNLTTQINQLKTDNPKVSSVIEALDELERIAEEDGGYKDEGLSKVLGFNESIGVSQMRDNYAKEEELLQQIFEASKKQGKTGYFSNFGNSADAGLGIVQDINESKDSQYENPTVRRLTEQYNNIKEDHDEYSEPFRDYISGKRQESFKNESANSATAGYFRPSFIGGQSSGELYGNVDRVGNMIDNDLMGGQSGTNAPDLLMTGKQRLLSDTRDKKDELQQLFREPKLNAREIKKSLAKLNKERSSEMTELIGMEGTQQAALAVLKDLMNDTVLASKP
tara:strand:- start:3408 stop:6254 length:2847 start_codon:yes stop_codon:yes gene_type:complete